MIDFNALFKVSYGLYLVSSGTSDQGNGYISNTVFQVTAEPPQFAAACNKDNYTSELISKTGVYAISVLKAECKPEIIGTFGYKSGKDISKFDGMEIKYGETGVPIVLNDSIAYLECKVNKTIDVGTHLLFIGDLISAVLIDESGDPLTYAYYRKVRKGIAPKNAPTYIDKSKLEKKEKTVYKLYKCPVCGYIFDEENGDPENGIKPGTLFSDLPDDWICPVCGTPKEDFDEL